MVASGLGGQGPMLMAVGWVESTISLFVIGLRLYSANQRAGEIRWDFVLIALAGVFGIASQATFAVSNYYGMGNHMANLTYPQIVAALQWVWMSTFIGLVALTLAKWAIIALLLQVHLPAQIKRRMFLWALAVLLGIVCVVQYALTFTQCKPARKLWDPRMPGTCHNPRPALSFGFFQGASGAAIDVILALYPISIVWNLQASLKMKVGFCLLMAGGLITAAVGAVKASMLTFLRRPRDFTYEWAPFMVYAATELWLIIILGSIPPLRPLFLRLFRKVSSAVRSGNASGVGSGAADPNQGSLPLQSVGYSAHANVLGRDHKDSRLYTSNVMSHGNDSDEVILRDHMDHAHPGHIVKTRGFEVGSEKRLSDAEEAQLSSTSTDLEHTSEDVPRRNNPRRDSYLR